MTYISPTKAFAHLDRLAAWSRGAKPAPVTVEWDLSNRCYLGCQSCHFAHTHVRGPWTRKLRELPMAYSSTGDLADSMVVYRGLQEMADAGVLGVVLSGGGEPTVHPEWLPIAQHAKAYGLKVGMYTAGGLLTPYTAERLSAVASWVVVSLDALDRETYLSEKHVDGFEAACNGLRWLSAAGGSVVGASFLLHAGNWRRADEMLALGRSLGATYVTFRPTIETSPDRPGVCVDDRLWIAAALPTLECLEAEPNVECDASRFAAYAQWEGRAYATCHGIKLHATVTPDGRVWVCPQRRGVAGSEVGDLRRESFRQIWDRHVGSWTEFEHCRVMCRLHLLNETLADVFAPQAHAEFV